jgi:hypothetical protein
MAETLGHSLRLDDGDLVLSDGTLATVAGQENLAQALVLRILTPLGSDPFATTYGLDVRSTFTEPVATHVMKELIRLNLVRTLSVDPRVREIRDIAIADDATSRRDRLWAVTVTIIDIAGAEHTVPLTIGA